LFSKRFALNDKLKELACLAIFLKSQKIARQARSYKS